MMALQEQTEQDEKFIPPAVERARQWVEANWRENPSLARVAAEARISKFYFHRLFKRLTGKTLKTYIEDFRTAEAKRLLLEGVSIGEVTVQLGFAHQSHFTARFRQQVGMPPAKWLRSFPVDDGQGAEQQQRQHVAA